MVSVILSWKNMDGPDTRIYPLDHAAFYIGCWVCPVYACLQEVPTYLGDASGSSGLVIVGDKARSSTLYLLQWPNIDLCMGVSDRWCISRIGRTIVLYAMPFSEGLHSLVVLLRKPAVLSSLATVFCTRTSHDRSSLLLSNLVYIE